jgi:tetratricopeptide (TPR) repeat protein
MAKGHMSRHELKEDRVLGWMEHLWIFVQTHKEKVIMGIAFLLVILGVYLSLSYMEEKRKEEAFNSLDFAKKDLSGKNKERALKKLKEIVADYAKLPEGIEALFLLLEDSYQARKYQACVDLSKEALKKFKGRVELATQLLLIQALSFEQLEEYDYAIKSLKRLVNQSKESYLKPEAYLSMARCYAFVDRIDMAKETYQEVVNQYPQTIWAKKAGNLLHHLPSA